MEMDSQSVTADSSAANSGNPAGGTASSCICRSTAVTADGFTEYSTNGAADGAADGTDDDGKYYDESEHGTAG